MGMMDQVGRGKGRKDGSDDNNSKKELHDGKVGTQMEWKIPMEEEEKKQTPVCAPFPCRGIHRLLFPAPVPLEIPITLTIIATTMLVFTPDPKPQPQLQTSPTRI